MELKDQVQGVVLGLFGAYAGGYFADLTAQAETADPVALVSELVNLQKPLLGVDLADDSTWVDTILAHLGIPSTSSAYTAAAAWANGELDAGASRAAVIIYAVNYLLGDDVAATYTAVADAFKAKVAEGVAWSEGDGAAELSVAELRAEAGFTGGVFNLTAALAELAAAEGNLESFLVALDLDEDGEADNEGAVNAAALNDAALDAAVAAAYTAVDGLVAGDYLSGNTAAVNAALLANEEAQNAADLTIAQNNLTAANAAVSAVTGLQAAITAYDAAVETAAATQDALDKAAIAYAAAMETYNVDSALADDITDTTAGTANKSDAGGVIIEMTNTGGVWSVALAAGVTETTNPGIGAVLTAAQAYVAALNADNTADAAVVTKEAAVVALDPTFGDADPLTTSLYEAQAAAAAAVEAAEDAIADLAEAVADLTAVKALDAERTDLETAISDAEFAIADAGYDLNAQGYDLDGSVTVTAGDLLAGADADETEVYTADGLGAAVALGVGDVISVSGYTYNSGALETAGNNSVLEFFITETAGVFSIVFEDSVFGSNTAGQAETTAVTLTGVTALEDLLIGTSYVQLA